MNLMSRGLHEKHVVATWNLGTVSAFAETSVELASRTVLLTSTQQSGKRKNMGDSLKVH